MLREQGALAQEERRAGQEKGSEIRVVFLGRGLDTQHFPRPWEQPGRQGPSLEMRETLRGCICLSSHSHGERAGAESGLDPKLHTEYSAESGVGGCGGRAKAEALGLGLVREPGGASGLAELLVGLETALAGVPRVWTSPHGLDKAGGVCAQ